VLDVELDVISGAVPVILMVDPDVETNDELCICKEPAVVVFTNTFADPIFLICELKI
jgi:hypothetical protein